MNRFSEMKLMIRQRHAQQIVVAGLSLPIAGLSSQQDITLAASTGVSSKSHPASHKLVQRYEAHDAPPQCV
jgi:hypothetical protein